MSSPPESTTIISPTPTPITALPISNSPIITTIPSSQSSNGHGLDNAEESPVASSSSSGLSNSTNLQGTPAFTSRTLQKTGSKSRFYYFIIIILFLLFLICTWTEGSGILREIVGA